MQKNRPEERIFCVVEASSRPPPKGRGGIIGVYFFELRMMSFRTQAMDCKTTAGQIMVKEG